MVSSQLLLFPHLPRLHPPRTNSLDTVPNSDPVSAAEKGLSAVLDGLQDRGVLQKSNRMDIEDLINNPDEKILIDLTTDEEIRDAVLSRRDNEQQMDINGGDDGSDGPTYTLPTRQEALSAASTLQKYINLNEDDFSAKTGSSLGQLW